MPRWHSPFARDTGRWHLNGYIEIEIQIEIVIEIE
jgi:hypothetical protein